MLYLFWGGMTKNLGNESDEGVLDFLKKLCMGNIILDS